MGVAQDNYFEKFNQLVRGVAKIAKGLKIAALVLLVPTIGVFIGALTYFYSTTDLGHWRWGIPCCIMLFPIICIGVVWWVLDAITSLPEVCTVNSESIKSLVQHHKKTIAEAEGKRLSKIKYLSILGKIFYGSTEVIDGVGMVAFASTPLFWILYLTSFIGSIVLSVLMILICVCHFFFG